MKLIEADEAFRVLSDYYHHRTETQADALREALDRVPEVVVNENITEYIVRETSYPYATKKEVIGKLVRCKDCAKSRPDGDYESVWLWCKRVHGLTRKNGFCPYGERKTAESE